LSDMVCCDGCRPNNGSPKSSLALDSGSRACAEWLSVTRGGLIILSIGCYVWTTCWKNIDIVNKLSRRLKDIHKYLCLRSKSEHTYTCTLEVGNLIGLKHTTKLKHRRELIDRYRQPSDGGDHYYCLLDQSTIETRSLSTRRTEESIDLDISKMEITHCDLNTNTNPRCVEKEPNAQAALFFQSHTNINQRVPWCAKEDVGRHPDSLSSLT
jgi:hypothetical protein